MKYIVASTAVTDEIHLPGGRIIEEAGGGAGWYAYAGMRIWTEDVLLVTGIGSDFLPLHGGWFERNRADTSGLILKTDRSPRTRVEYRADGERKEFPVYGLGHYKSIEPAVEDLEPFCSDCRGMYVFKNTEDLRFWEELAALKQRYGFKLLWEIAADAAVPAHRETIMSLLSQVDVLSINRSEASSLFDAEEEESLSCLAALGLPLVFYRKGTEGALMLHNGARTAVPRVETESRKDPTGAGNSSSAAVLVGFCEHRIPREAGLMGSVSAAYMIGQYGPAPRLDEELKTEAASLLRKTLLSHERREE